MPNVNPRLQVILPTHVYEVLSKLAHLQGRSRSSIARDFLTEVAPVLARVANTLEAAAAMDARGRAKLVRSLEAVQGTLEAQAAHATETLDTALPGRKAAVGKPRRGVRRRSRTDKPPN